MSGWELAVVGAAVVGWALGVLVWWRFRRGVIALLRDILSELRRR